MALSAEQANRLRLKHIKLAGFKSFVDPTTVPFPSNLVAIVGPNGCGKSNVIDAVRWVMGESSAKYLRGESMTDVIFNGSSQRKPVGQASIELVFSNPNSAIAGEYANYAEISLRRTVNRESQSTYYLNGTKCRRKDIIDIFLGTGLGSRSYSIIGQGTISRIIEARPEELRVYLEEAAGISKYKERRRETELRIKHTNDNLDELNVLRDELGKQLNHLQRQATAAERYKELKAEERVFKAQLLALKWQELDGLLKTHTTSIAEQETALEAVIADIRSLDASLEELRDQHVAEQDAFNEIQGGYYAIGADVSRLEQTVKHHQERVMQLEDDVASSQTSYANAKGQFEEDEVRVNTLTAELEQILPELEQALEAKQQATQHLETAESNMQNWQQRWDDFNQQAAKSQQQAQVQQTRIQHFEKTIEKSKAQLTRIQEEQGRFNLDEVTDEIVEFKENIDSVDSKSTELRQNHDNVKQQLAERREQQQTIQSQLDSGRSELQRLQGRFASLEALQQAALGRENDAVMCWLEQQNLQDQPRLAQGLTVESGWETAVETVLGAYLQAVCVSELEPVSAVLTSLEKGNLALFDTSTRSINSTTANLPTLASQIKSDWNIADVVSGVYVAEDLTAALQMRSQLKAHESVITKDGVWLGHAWLRVYRDEDTQAGVIQREQALKELTQDIAKQEQAVADLQQQLQTCREELQALEAEREQKQAALREVGDELADLKAQLRIKENRKEQINQRLEQLKQDQTEHTDNLAQAQVDLDEARGIWQQAMQSMDVHADQREKLQTERDTCRQALADAKQLAQVEQQKAHQHTLNQKTLQAELDTKQQHIVRMQQQMEDLQDRQQQLTQSLAEAREPIDGLKQQLETKLKERLTAEEGVTKARQQLQSLDHKLREQEKQRHELEQKAQRNREKLEKSRLDSQGLLVRRDTVIEQLEEAEENLEEVIKTLTEEANIKAWDENLQRIANRISRLGAINLAAIDEFAQQSERKQYLDSQHEDLQQALHTLEEAIRKIDKETRQRFKDTYDIVNNHFKTLFPKVFGGGSAYLELTGEDLLDTGVAVMARPPGKRNTTIHLLSGGEKALTAIALVFSIFQLNPAPFCMLDEVDAPLDDANVVRYCNLVKEMSKDVQFIFISHNKIAIEMAEHLAGVTMKEPGVSRMVSVDIDAAVAMAEN